MTSSYAQSSSMTMCRICLENRSEMYSIFSKLDGGPLIASIITDSTAVQIQEDDGLPKCICPECVEEVKMVSNFVEKTRQSDQLLKDMCKTEVKKEEDEQLYALEISLVDDDDMEPKVEDIDEEMDNIAEDDIADSEEPADFDDANDSDYEVEQDSDSDEDFEPESKSKSELSFVDANNVSSDDSDQKTKPRKRRRSTKKLNLGEPDPDHLDEVEEKTFTIVDVGDKIVCCTCFKLFDSEEELIDHGKSVHKARRSLNSAKKHVCKLCFRRYSTKVALQAHQKNASQVTRVYNCNLCQANFISPQKRQQHAHNHPPVKSKSAIIVAPIPIEVLNQGKICCAQGCNQVFQTEEELLAHSDVDHAANKVQAALNMNNNNRPIQCRVCFRRFIDEKGLKNHQQRLYLPKKHVCSICGLKFATSGECKRHETEHVPTEKQFKCDQCPKAYCHKDQLKAHVKRHSATREFMCNVCGQSYMQRHNLQAHMLKHEGKLPFECDICKKAFRVKAKMIYHKRVHSGERPFACRYCEQAFADSTNRLRHEMSHTGVKPYKCDYCEKTFITKRLKREHEKTHFNTSRRGQKVIKVVYDEIELQILE